MLEAVGFRNKLRKLVRRPPANRLRNIFNMLVPLEDSVDSLW